MAHCQVFFFPYPPPLKETTERDKEIAVLSPYNMKFCAQWGEHHLGAGRSLEEKAGRNMHEFRVSILDHNVHRGVEA
jgi:hypothetical protein